MNSLQPDWGILYYADLELVKGYISASEFAYNEYLDGQEKARSRRLKFAYQLAGGSVVVGVLILMLSMWALGQKKEAESQTERAELEKRRQILHIKKPNQIENVQLLCKLSLWNQQKRLN